MQSLTSSCKICANLIKNGTDISISTVLRCLSKKLSLKSYNPAAKPCLISAIKKKRLSFANKCLHWNVKKWETVLFFDESLVKQFAVQKRHVQRPHPPSQIVWGP